MKVLYLLPSEKKQSVAGLPADGELSFPFLEPYREKVFRAFPLREPKLPAWRRFRGEFWSAMETWCLPADVKEELFLGGVVLSPLAGLVKPLDPLPQHSLTFRDELEGESLLSFWKKAFKEVKEKLPDGELRYELVSEEQAKLLPTEGLRVRFYFYKKGKRVLKDAKHRAYALRYLLEKKVKEPKELKKINFYDYRVKELREEGNLLKVILEGDGEYL